MTPWASSSLAFCPLAAAAAASPAKAHLVVYKHLNGVSICSHRVVRATADPIKVRKCHRTRHSRRRRHGVVCAIGGGEVYQPFRAPIIDHTSTALSAEELLQILRERRWLWHQLAPHITSLSRLGFSPSSIEEATGISGVEQNELVVASQVRSSLETSGMERAALDFFDAGGSDILYELRMLPANQRKSAAEFALLKRMDAKDAKELARAMKDYVRRKNTEGWSAFSFSPGDCLAFACYRGSKEYPKDDPERRSILEKGLSFVESRAGRMKLLRALDLEAAVEVEVEKEDKVGEEKVEKRSKVDIVRLSLDEISSFVMLAVAESNPSSIEAAPYNAALAGGPFGIYRTETSWSAWVPLPPWDNIVEAKAPVAILFSNIQKLSTIVSLNSKIQEPILVVVDKGELEPEENAYYLVAGEKGEDTVSIHSGSVIIQNNTKALAKFLIALSRPVDEPNPEDIEWD